MLSNQDIDDLTILVFLTVHGYLINFGDANLTVNSLVHNESKCVEIFRQSVIVNKTKAFDCFYF
jgi:hypothetical protein